MLAPTIDTDRLRFRAEDQDIDADGADAGTLDDINAIAERRIELRKQAAEDLEARAVAIARNLEQIVVDYVEGRAGSTETAKIRAAIAQTQLDDLLDLLDDNGMQAARDAIYGEDGTYEKLAGLAEKMLAAAGVADADRALDSETAQATIDAARDLHEGEWVDGIARPSATRMLSALQTSIELRPLHEIARTIARDEEISLPKATVQARTRMAEFDRYAQMTAAVEADPDGDALVWIYTGPTGHNTQRPFCKSLTTGRYYFTRAQVGRLDNGIASSGPPAIEGGGPNCLHGWSQMPPEAAEALGYTAGTDDDVDAANAAAREKRK